MSVVSLSLTGLLQIHIPFVHGLVVGPIANPSILKNTSISINQYNSLDL